MEILERFKNKFDLKSMIGNLVKDMLPQLAANLKRMSKPQEEGGLLKEGEDKIVWVILENQGEASVMICPLTFEPGTGKMWLGKPISNNPVGVMLEANLNKMTDGD